MDAPNFLLADVRGAPGPYLNGFLVTQQHWSQSSVGVVTTVSGLPGLMVQTPIGAAIDATHAKRGLIVAALAVLAAGAVVIYALPTFWPVLIANTLIAVVGDVFGPEVSALTLGLCARTVLAIRLGRAPSAGCSRNERYSCWCPFAPRWRPWQRCRSPAPPSITKERAAVHKELATAMMSACIIAAQLIMLPIDPAVGRYADRIGRKPILLVCFATLPVRPLLYTLSDNTVWPIGVQLLDGVGASIVGAITPLLIADLTRGTGRYNIAQGAVATVQGIGASVSGLAVGIIVDRFGYTTAFLDSAVAAAVALAALVIAMPKTAPA